MFGKPAPPPSGAAAAGNVSVGLFVTGAYSGNNIVRFDPATGEYLEHFEDPNLKHPRAIAYDDHRCDVDETLS